MAISDGMRRELNEALDRLKREHLLVIELNDLADLLVAPDRKPFEPPRGPAQPALDDLTATLTAARSIPDELTVRVVLPAGASPGLSVGDIQAAVHTRAARLASATWRDAVTIRTMGRRQLPIGLLVALLSWVISAAAAAAAASVDSALLIGVLVAVAGPTLMVAWVVSWLVIEAALMDWRQPRSQASAYELLSRCTLEITYQRSG